MSSKDKDPVMTQFLTRISNLFNFHCDLCNHPMTLQRTGTAYDSNWWCDICKNRKQTDEYAFHCPAKFSSDHPHGYDYCLDCSIARLQLDAIKAYEKNKPKQSTPFEILVSNDSTIRIPLPESLGMAATFQRKLLEFIQTELNKGADNKSESDDTKVEGPYPQLTEILNSLKMPQLLELQKSSTEVIDASRELLKVAEDVKQTTDSQIQEIYATKQWEKWTSEDVIQWFCAISGGKYKDILLKDKVKEKDIRGEHLEKITEQTLELIGIKKMDHVLDIQDHIKSLQSKKQETDYGSTRQDFDYKEKLKDKTRESFSSNTTSGELQLFY